ncbi:unnamed protein product [Schistosoma haematobium]|nr:unnamed protein product [Schistosoma haematobium]
MPTSGKPQNHVILKSAALPNHFLNCAHKPPSVDNATGSLPQSLRKSGYELPLYPFINSECASLKDPRDRNFA